MSEETIHSVYWTEEWDRVWVAARGDWRMRVEQNVADRVLASVMRAGKLVAERDRFETRGHAAGWCEGVVDGVERAAATAPPFEPSIAHWQAESHQTALAKGWHEGALNVPEKLALIHSEVSEALECYRVGDMEARVEANGKPCGFASELADVVIRVLDLAGALGMSMQDAMRVKAAFNRTRPHRHGGKRC